MAVVLIRTHTTLRKSVASKVAALKERGRNSLHRVRSAGRTLKPRSTRDVTVSLADLHLLKCPAPVAGPATAARALPPVPASKCEEANVYIDME